MVTLGKPFVPTIPASVENTRLWVWGALFRLATGKVNSDLNRLLLSANSTLTDKSRRRWKDSHVAETACSFSSLHFWSIASKNGDIGAAAAAAAAVAMIGKVKRSDIRRTVMSETDWNNVAGDVDLDNNDSKQT